jgi:hypothetical protein
MEARGIIASSIQMLCITEPTVTAVGFVAVNFIRKLTFASSFTILYESYVTYYLFMLYNAYP